MTTIIFELYASLERLAGTREYRLDADGAVTVGDALERLTAARPELAESVSRCACASGDAIVRRTDPLPGDGRIALLPPVAGG